MDSAFRRLWLTLGVNVVVLPGLLHPVYAQTQTTTYLPDTSIFPNPERGFYSSVDVNTERDFSSLSNTFLHSYVRIDAYKNGADIGFGDAVLSDLRDGLAAVRAHGKKIILRFAYNFGDYDETHPFHCTNADASEATILKHVGQVASSLEPYKDVIVSFQAGFIGCWGEWHSSWYQGDAEMPPKISIVQRIADTFAWTNSEEGAYPYQSPVAVRYPNLIRNLLASSLTATAKDRIGSHQDCFLASDPDDWGTWGRDPAYTPAQDKALIAALGVDHMVGGETCNVDSPRANCATARAELQMMHFTYLNEDYEPAVIQVFKDQGCFDEFKQKLGYRLRLTSATYSNPGRSGSPFVLQASLANDGYASVIGERPLFAVLDGVGGRFAFRLSADPQSWKSGAPAVVNGSFIVPTTVPAGVYRLSLWLPDRTTSLRADPRYSIRMANQGTWDPATGENVLATNVLIEQTGSFPSRGFHTIAPCRIVDTRAPLSGPALVASEVRAFNVVGACGIPAGATAASLNLTVTQPTATGNLRLFPHGAPVPLTAALNYSAGQTRGNNAIVALGADGRLSVRLTQGTGIAHLILDVNGYFVEEQ
jgi:Domain of unknown function (DUF4832)/Domain of unknown function (DUF4874)